MKKLLFIFSLFLICNTLYAQNVELQIQGLISPKKTTQVNVLSANLETVTLQNHRGVAYDAEVYVVTRNQDNRTPSIVEAINKGRQFPEIFINIRMANGTTIMHKLTRAYLLNYTSQNNSGQDPTEEFYINFQSHEVKQG